MSKRTAAFSLIELLLVVAIVAVLVAMAVPVYSSYVRQASFSSAKTALFSILDKTKAYYAAHGEFASAEDLGYDDGGSGSTVVDPQTAVHADISFLDISRTYFAVGCSANMGMIYSIMPYSVVDGRDLLTVFYTYDLNGALKMECLDILLDAGAAYPSGNPVLNPGITCPSSNQNEQLVTNSSGYFSALAAQLCP